MGSMLIVVFCVTTTNAQNAEKLFKNNYKWGLTAQFNIFSGSKNSGNNDNFYYKLAKSKMPSVGVQYNFYQYKNWNFKADVQLQWFGDKDRFFIAGEETVLSSYWSDLSYSNLELILYVPVTVEYVFSSNKKINFSIGGGLGISYFKFNESAFSSFSLNHILIFSNYYHGNGDYYTSGHLEAGIYYKTKGGTMFKTSLLYKKSFKDFRTGETQFLNLQQSPDTTIKLEQTGNFIGLSTTIYFKIKKKKK